jgi:hypothetical protein
VSDRDIEEVADAAVSTSGRGPWQLACDDYVLRVRSREAAEWNRDNIERRGYCQNRHRIVGPDGVEVS